MLHVPFQRVHAGDILRDAIYIYIMGSRSYVHFMFKAYISSYILTILYTKSLIYLYLYYGNIIYISYKLNN